ncbi:MAG: ABC transporter substrate-binding protein [Lachnospiraceae bacterium]|nr:ABC transporter substrate-binding protein [Lachnospiraceae bacterium]
MKKKLIGILVSAATVMTLLAGCGAAEQANVSSDEYVVKIGYSTGLCHAPIHIAIENGYFEEEGLKFEAITVESAVISEAVGTGQVDAGFGLVGKFVQPLENGLPMKLTAGIHTGCTKLVVPNDSDIQTVADLKGKRIGVASLADSPCLTAKRSLAKAGVGVTAENMEVEFVVYSNTDLPMALQNGAIDAYCAADPAVSKAQEEYNLRAIIDTTTDDDYKDEYCCLSFVTTNLAENYPDLAAKYTRAVMKAAKWIEENSEEAAKIQLDNNYVTGELDFNAAILESYNYIPSVSGGYDALAKSVEELQAIGIIRKETDAQALIDNSFVRLDGVEDTY